MSPVAIGDARLVEQTRAGDREAFAVLLHRYRDAVFGVALHHTGDRHDAEDLAQDAFVQAYARLAELRDPGRFAPWLFAITRSLVGRWARAERRRPHLSEAEPAVDGPEEPAATRDLVRRALAALPPENGLAVTLFLIDGYTYGEISAFLDVPETTLKGRIERGRRRLKEEMITMLREHLDEQKPGRELEEMVLRRVTGAEIWADDAHRRQGALPGFLFLLDGRLARFVFQGEGGSSCVEARARLVPEGTEPVRAYRSLSDPNRLYIFGRGRLEPGGQVVADGLFQARPAIRLVPRDEPAGAESVLPRIDSGALAALPPPERARALESLALRPGQVVWLDGGPGEVVLAAAGPGGWCATPGDEATIRNTGTGRLDVLHTRWPEPRYVVLGEALVDPPGLRVTDGSFGLEAEPLGGALDYLRRHAARLDELPLFPARALWAQGGARAAERLDDHAHVLLDGEPCARVVPERGGGLLTASCAIHGCEGRAWTLYRLIDGPNRWYVVGRARAQEGDVWIEDQAVEATVALAPAASQSPVPYFAALTAEDLAEPSGPALRELHGSVRLLLGGGPAHAPLLGGASGSWSASCGMDVGFRNVGEGPLHIHRWLWPEPVYFVFGEAEVAPPGIRVQDAAVRLVARG